MRNKRLIAIIAALTLLFAQMNFVIGSAEETEKTSLYTESELAVFNSKHQMLLDLDIFPDLSKDAEGTITRGEFAGVMAKVLGSSMYEASFAENTYVDIKEDTPNAEAIVGLKKMGIMVGMNAVEFRPDDKVTYAQAIKVLVAGLGYRELAEVSGGYYSGYLKKAIDLGILRKGSSDYDRELTVYDAVLMIDAALEAEIPVVYSADGKYITYENNKGKNLLSVYHDIYKIKGIMTDNGQTALSSKSKVGLGNTVVGGQQLIGIEERFTDLIGYNVVAYYKQGSDKTFLHAYADSVKNDVLVIDAYDLITDSPKFSKSNIVYKKENGKTQNVEVSVYADFIYNGSAFPSFVGETLKIPTGTLTLIDANRDGSYETIVAHTFDDVLVKTVNTATGGIYSNYYDPILYSEYDVVHFYNTEGKEVKVTDIKNDSLVSVYKSKDFTKLIVHISDAQSAMVIDNITEDEEEVMYITVGENTYRIGEWYMAAIESSDTILKAPVIGAKYTVYFNVAGEAAMFQEIQLREEYAYLLAVGNDSSDNLGGTKVAVRVVNEQGDEVIVKSARNYTVIDSAGVHENDSNAVTASAELYDRNGKFIPQLIRMKVNSKGEFTKLEYDNTIPSAEELPNGFDQSKFNKVCESSYSLYSNYQAKTLNGKYIVDKNTKIFLVEDINTLVTEDETKVKVIPYSEFKVYNVKAAGYDPDQNWALGAMVCSQQTSSFDDRTFTVVNSKVIIDEFGEERYQIDGYWKNNIWTFREHTPGVFMAALDKHNQTKGTNYTTIERGDVFRIAFDNPKQEIVEANLVFSPTRDERERRETFYAMDYSTVTWASVIGVPISGTDGSLGIMANGEYYVETFSSSTFVVIFDQRSGEITRGDKTKVPTIGSVDKEGNIDVGDRSIMVYGARERYNLQDILVVLK